MEQFLNIKYILSESENFEEFMVAVGMGYMARKIVGLLTPTIELKKDGDVYSFITSSTFKTMTLAFKLNEEFDEVKPDGTVLKTVCTIEGNKLILRQKKDKEIVIIREFSETEVKVTMTVDDIMCNRVFTVVN